MAAFPMILVASALAISAPSVVATGSSAPEHEAVVAGHDDVSAARRYYRRYAPHYAPAEPRYHGRVGDPSLGPDGRPYPVPEYLRNQCYIDEGYGRFSACQNR